MTTQLWAKQQLLHFGVVAIDENMPLDEFLASEGGGGLVSPLQLFAQGAQLVLIFGIVLVIAYVCTRWIAGARYRHGIGGNLQLLESIALGQQAYLQLVRVGGRYFVVGLTKNGITQICELDAAEVSTPEAASVLGEGYGVVSAASGSFEKYLKKFIKDKDRDIDKGKDE